MKKIHFNHQEVAFRAPKTNEDPSHRFVAGFLPQGPWIGWNSGALGETLRRFSNLLPMDVA